MTKFKELFTNKVLLEGKGWALKNNELMLGNKNEYIKITKTDEEYDEYGIMIKSDSYESEDPDVFNEYEILSNNIVAQLFSGDMSFSIPNVPKKELKKLKVK